MELPLFPGYVFCQFDRMNRLPILTVPGIVHIVGIGRSPMPVDDTEIASIQAAVKSGLPSQPWPFLEAGDKVRIERGPLSGVEGILLGFRGQQRLVLSITLLQRSVGVLVDTALVRMISRRNSAPAGFVASHATSTQPAA